MASLTCMPRVLPRSAPSAVPRRSVPRRGARPVCQSSSLSPNEHVASTSGRDSALARRSLLLGASAAPLLWLSSAQDAQAVQGVIAGRLPGLTPTPDSAGFYTYQRPEGKSGGHGIGWSEVPRYSFKVPAGWEEIPVSIADLGGAEIDLRFQSREQGDISVVVAPVLRFMDAGFNANIRIQDIGPPEKIIQGFGPELFGKALDEFDVIKTEVEVKADSGLMYYYWQVKPHNWVAATAVRNRMFIMTVAANSRQNRKHSDSLAVISKSFDVPLEEVKVVGPRVSSQGV